LGGPTRLLDSGPLGAAGRHFRRHEFHYATVVHHSKADPLLSVKDAAGEDLDAYGLRRGSVFGSFIHLVNCCNGL
jgi:cobyrinic acid a,c-diamide synthase